MEQLAIVVQAIPGHGRQFYCEILRPYHTKEQLHRGYYSVLFSAVMRRGLIHYDKIKKGYFPGK